MFKMVKNVFRNLGSKPATRRYPYEKREPFAEARGQLGIDIENCIFCGICSRKCPPSAISVSKADKSWEFDPFRCVVCGECTDACPKKCLRLEKAYHAPARTMTKSRHVQGPKPVQQVQENSNA